MIATEKKVVADSPEKIAAVIKAIIETYEPHEQDKEHFYAIGMNNRNVIQYVDLVSIGTMTECILHPREIFRYAIMKGISSIIVSHNHPSRITTPSREDIAVTKRLKEAGDIIGIKLLDHVIVGDSWLSMVENNFF